MATRMNGIISGLDTEALVKAQVSYQQLQIDRLTKSNTKLQWQKESYLDIYKKMDTYRNKVYNYKLDSTTKLKSVTGSNDSALGVKANADATVGVHSITVYQMATGAQSGSKEALGSSDNKTSIEKQLLNADGSTKYTGTIDININGKKVSVDTSKSMNEMVKAINNSGAGVKASYDANTDRIFFSAEGTGKEAKIDFSGTTGAGVEFLRDGLKLYDEQKDSEGNVTGRDLMGLVEGQNAKFDLDGVKGLEQNSNEFTISGITYSLKDADAVNGKTTTVTVKNDNDGMLKAVKDFVDQYNEMLESINGVIYQQKNKSFEPLTADQKKDMTADQIKDWEEKAKAGVLHGDSILRGVVNNMRTSIYTSINGIDGKYNSLFAIGIKTGDYSTNGKLVIDEDKLKKAIEEDPDAIAKILNGTTDKNGKETAGVADKLYDQLKTGLDKIDSQSGAAKGSKDTQSYLSKVIARNEKTIATKTARMNQQMETYYKQYDAMESMLEQLQKQQETLASYMSA